jgi:enoyl-CoA hydratase/carnithine racemase
VVIGAVHGYAVGGGFEWVLNCDMVVAADSLVCFFPEMALGHFVTGGVTHLLPQALGHQRTMELIVLGERQSAQRLHALGLVNRVVGAEVMLQEAVHLAQTGGLPLGRCHRSAQTPAQQPVTTPTCRRT